MYAYTKENDPILAYIDQKSGIISTLFEIVEDDGTVIREPTLFADYIKLNTEVNYIHLLE